MSTHLDNTLAKTFQSCGFDGKECLILGFLARYSRKPAVAIARGTRLKRTTVYSLLGPLIDQGLVVRERSRTGTAFSLVQSDLLHELLEGRARTRYDRVKEASAVLRQTLNTFEKGRLNLDLGGYEVRAIDSTEAVYGHLEEALMHGGYRGFFNPQTALVGKAKKVVERFLERTALSKPPIREIAVPGPATDWYRSQIRNPNHELREFAAGTEFLTDTIISDEAVLFVHYHREPMGAIVIREAELCRTLGVVFDLLWESLGPRTSGPR